MKSLGSPTSDSSDRDKPDFTTNIFPQSYRPAQQAAETNGPAQVATVQLDTGNVGSPDAKSGSDTESDESEETTSSESTVSAGDSHAAEDAHFASQSPRISSLPQVTCQQFYLHCVVVVYLVLIINCTMNTCCICDTGRYIINRNK